MAEVAQESIFSYSDEWDDHPLVTARIEGGGDPWGDECPNCGRPHLYLCKNGKHLCDKCDWSPELGMRVNVAIPLV